MLRVVTALLVLAVPSFAQVRSNAVSVSPNIIPGNIAVTPSASVTAIGLASLPSMISPLPVLSAPNALKPAPAIAVQAVPAALSAALSAVPTAAPSSPDKAAVSVERQQEEAGAMFDGTTAARPESQAWSLPDGGPLMGRALRPRGYVFGGRRYIDLMNPAAVRLRGKDGRPRDFIWVRAVRAGYATTVGPIGEVATGGYLSDTLLFELRPGRAPRFIERALESTPERLREDPRLSRLKLRGRDERGRFTTEERLYLGVTDHAVHGAMTEKTSVNAFVSIVVDQGGVPRVARDEAGAPRLVALSPEPLRNSDGTFSVVDAKNGVLAADNAGNARMLSRHRYAASDPRLPTSFSPADYAEQSFPLSRNELERGPDWSRLMKDLAAREALRGTDLPEHYPAERLWNGAAKGHGPGAPPVRMRRRGGSLFVSEGFGYPWVWAGSVPKNTATVLADGQTAFLSFDHEIRFLNVGGKRKRVYSLSLKLRDAALDRVIAYYADAVQPQRPYETANPGIPDLWHVYPTGRVINDDGTVDTFEGAADSNVVRRRWNLARLLTESGWTLSPN